MKKKRILYALLLLGLLSSISLPAEAQRARRDGLMEKYTVAQDEEEQRVLDILTDIDQNQNYRNVPDYDGRFLRVLAEAIGARNVVEVGTANGYSTIWLGLAIRKTDGKIITYEIDPERAANARNNFARAGMQEFITLIEGDAHENILSLPEHMKEVDFIFLDADKKGYLDYLQKTLPLLRPGGLIVGHNITPEMVDPAFIEAITTNSQLETIVRGGVSVSVKKR